MRRVNLNFVIISLVIFGVALLKSRKTVEEPPVAAKNPAPASTPLTAKVAAVPGLPGIKPAPILKVIPKLDVMPEPYAKELGEYSVLKKKIFLTPAEELSRKSLLANENILRGIRTRLLRSPATPKEAVEQNAAIDLLLDAVRSGDNEVAVDVLRTVVADGQVEDESLPRATRENLAGIKGEVLYQWSALKPAQANELASMLPGPVSQRIWQNVLDAQQSNLSESAALAH